MVRRSAPDQDVSGTVLRLAILLEAGLAPGRVWRHLADAGDRTARAVHDAGAPLAGAIAAQGGAWRDVAAAWRVATEVGAPLAVSLRGIADAVRDASATVDEVRVTLAEPAASARLMTWLPLIAVPMSLVLGFDTLGVLVTRPAGVGCLVAGLALVVAARRWTTVLVRRAQPAPGVPGLHAELVAIALSGGVSIDRARALVAEATDEPEDAGDAAVLALSHDAGVPAVELLRAAAAISRHAARTEGRLRAARLSSRLLLPLGVCTLPAFMLLGVAPMMLGVLDSTSLTL